MANIVWWFEFQPNPEGRAHKPQLKNGKLPTNRKMDNGTLLAEIVANKKAVVTAEEINSLAFASRQDAVGFWEVVSRKIAAPRPKRTEVQKPVSDLDSRITKASTDELPPCDDDDEIIGKKPEPQKEWFVFVKKDGSNPLVAQTVTTLGKNVKQVTQTDFQAAEDGIFPSQRLLEIAFENTTRMKEFSDAYKRGLKKRK